MKEAWTSTAQLWYNQTENLLRIEMKPTKPLTLDDMRNHYVELNRLTEGRKALVLINFGTNFSAVREARQYTVEQSAHRIATAVIADSWFARLKVNYYMYFNKYQTPIQFFLSEENAINWLKSFK